MQSGLKLFTFPIISFERKITLVCMRMCVCVREWLHFWFGIIRSVINSIPLINFPIFLLFFSISHINFLFEAEFHSSIHHQEFKQRTDDDDGDGDERTRGLEEETNQNSYYILLANSKCSLVPSISLCLKELFCCWQYRKKKLENTQTHEQELIRIVRKYTRTHKPNRTYTTAFTRICYFHSLFLCFRKQFNHIKDVCIWVSNFFLNEVVCFSVSCCLCVSNIVWCIKEYEDFFFFVSDWNSLNFTRTHV